MDVDDAGFGARLRACREAAGLSQQELANLSALSIRAVRNMESGRTQWPYRASLSRLADALGLRATARADFLAAVPRRQLARPPMAGDTTPAGNGPAAHLGPLDRAPAAGIKADGPGEHVGDVPRQLPAALACFTGRAAELQALTSMLDRAGRGAPGTVVISAIGGTAGVGKTALAIHWAHQVAARFPDGQLYVNMRGFDHSGTPTAPEVVIRGVLDALGVPSERIPAGPQAQAGLYRSLMAGKRMLIVLDNAIDEQQVRPLLPASPGSMVIVTSRRQLAGLAAANGARLVTLDVLSHADAVQLLTVRLGASRVAAEPDAVGLLAGLCGCLPLALAVAAARAAARPGFPLASVAEELADSAGRLDALGAGDPATSVRAVLSWSTRQLSPAAARMFRLLGLHPGPDISAPAAASLAGIAEGDARRVLAGLVRSHLIAERVRGRYAFHDLLHAYAAAEARAIDSQDEREAAVGRMLDHYLHTAAAAARVLIPSTDPGVLDRPRPGASPEQPADYAQALAWFEAEHEVLLGVIRLTAGTERDCHAWQLPWATTPFLRLRGHWQDCAAIQRTALAAAARRGDTAAQAISSRLLASTCADLGDLDQARGHYADSLRLYKRLGDRLGEAKVCQGLGGLAEGQSRYGDALGHDEQALRLYRAAGDKPGEAAALNCVGWDHALLGDYHQARAFCRQSLTLCAEEGFPWLEGNAWDSLGYAEHHLGSLAEAAACYRRALSSFREGGDRFHEARSLTHLGDTCQAAGDVVQAQEAWQQALAIFDDLQHPDADQLRPKLASAGDAVSKPCA